MLLKIRENTFIVCVEKYLHISRSAQFKPVLFISQLILPFICFSPPPCQAAHAHGEPGQSSPQGSLSPDARGRYLSRHCHCTSPPEFREQHMRSQDRLPISDHISSLIQAQNLIQVAFEHWIRRQIYWNIPTKCQRKCNLSCNIAQAREQWRQSTCPCQGSPTICALCAKKQRGTERENVKAPRTLGW